MEAAGLRQTLRAIAGTAKPPKPSLSELLDHIKVATAQGHSLEAFLEFLTLSQQYIGDLLRIPIEAGQGFRREAGHHSGLKPATVPT